jgi:hypothetical protein
MRRKERNQGEENQKRTMKIMKRKNTGGGKGE